MIAVGVTAFVPIPDHPRPAEEYHQLAQPLIELGREIPFLSVEGDITKCWLYRHLLEQYDMDTAHFSYSIADNPRKNSLWYHIVQAQKTEWLVAAAMADRISDVFVWVDYGIFHIPGVTVQIIKDFMLRAADEQAIAIPGCWERDQYEYNDLQPYWRFCGGVMVVPRKFVGPLDVAMKGQYISWLHETQNISWEVNTLARLEQQDPDFPVWWYKADHDSSMFTNYKATEFADGQQAKALRGLESRYC